MASTHPSATNQPEPITSSLVESLHRRDRLVVLAGLILLTGLSWAYMGYLAWEMQRMPMEMAMAPMQRWGPVELVLLFLMWAVMMVAMMVPSATPMVLTFAAHNRRRHAQQQPYAPTGLFLLGYLAVWTGFSLIATLIQWGLHEASLLSPMMVSNSPLLGGGLLIVAGIFQWTPLKSVCLKHCRTPLGFLLHNWQEGRWGAFRMGFEHGSYCTGCCWVLMLLLFVAGVMNLLWIGLIALLVLVEKVVPRGLFVGKAAGLVMVAAGIAMVLMGMDLPPSRLF